MKIIIIGLGKMGKSHLRSFINSKKNYEIDIVDIVNMKKDKSIPTKNINFFKKIPINKKYDLAIIATSSVGKFNLVSYLLENNKVNFLLLEKITFSKIDEYQKAFKIFHKLKTKVMVNTWGQHLALKFSKIINKNKKIKYDFINSERNLIANIPHFFEFIKFFSKKNFTFNLTKIEKIIDSKWKNYDEILGLIVVKNSDFIANFSTTKDLIKNNIDILIKFKIKKSYFKFIMYDDSKCVLYENDKIIKNFFFPFFAFKTNENFFYQDYINDKKKRRLLYFNNYKSFSKTIVQLMTALNKKFKKRILIT